jgi:hypothetical protein
MMELAFDPEFLAAYKKHLSAGSRQPSSSQGETAQREHAEPFQVREKLVAGVRFELTTFGL